MRERKQPKERKRELLESAISLAKEVGYSHITRDGIAERAGVSYSLVNNYFKNINYIKRLVMKEAISNEIVEILAQGLVLKDPLTKKLSPQLKAKVLKHLSI